MLETNPKSEDITQIYSIFFYIWGLLLWFPSKLPCFGLAWHTITGLQLCLDSPSFAHYRILINFVLKKSFCYYNYVFHLMSLAYLIWGGGAGRVLKLLFFSESWNQNSFAMVQRWPPDLDIMKAKHVHNNFRIPWNVQIYEKTSECLIFIVYANIIKCFRCSHNFMCWQFRCWL